ncbi:MAG: enoyl-CoA hydratase/isomerase family protein [Dehalococcoidia bacterium]|nr:enoyl-CoA hydratase/isomerase family protein [Dehalococcoidia bacterium]
MTYERLLVEKKDDVMRVSFNNPRLHNAMDGQMLEELVALLHELNRDTVTRFVVLTGEGKSFMAGVDLKSDAMSVGSDPSSARMRQRLGQELVKTLRELEQITVAAVSGACVGAGLAIAVACDLRVAAEDSTWSLPNTSLGYFFSWACTPLLVSLVGPGNAKDLILTRRQLTAAEAVNMNLANVSVSSDALMSTADGIVERMRAGGPVAMRMAKKLVNAASPAWFGDVSTAEPELIERLYAEGEPVEGNAAFLARRPPTWAPKEIS